MAEGGYDPRLMNRQKKNQLCRYYVHGACKWGQACNFVHSRDGTAPRDNVCRFYQLGKCSYGKHCRYDHVKTSNQLEDRVTNSIRSDYKNDDRQSNMIVLKREGLEKSLSDATEDKKQQAFQEKWVKASDFVPGQKYHKNTTYASTTKTDLEPGKKALLPLPPPEPAEKDLLCPYFAHGNCPLEERCNYIHGDICDVCNYPRLHPTDEKLRDIHKKECMAEMEKDMELSFAVKESQDKECCICLEMVMEKARSTKSDTRFGILENCAHCFCLSCIRRWRGDKSFGKNVRVCPICRVHSDFVTPSKFWVEEEDKKKKLIQDYKNALMNKPCQYFKLGKGECPFNEKCFYRHAYPDGTIAQPKPWKRRRRVNADGEENLMDTISLWNFLEHRDSSNLSLDDELSMFLSLVLSQDSDEDYWDWQFNYTFSDSDSGSEWDF